MMNFRTKEHGVTLVETVIYTALVASLSILLVSSLLILYRAFGETRGYSDLLESAQVSMERMTREIRGASSINTGSSTLGTTPGVLSLSTGGTPATVSFSVSDGAIIFSENGTSSGALTDPSVTVSSLVFRSITTTAGSAVRIEMTLLSERSRSGKTMTLYDTVTLRGDY